MKKKVFAILAVAMSAVMGLTALTACGSGFKANKQITVIARENSSGTREAFDTVVTDGEHFLQEKDASGAKVYHTTDTASVQNKTGTVLSQVATDNQAIGYISLGSVDDTVKVVKVEGVTPSKETVLNKSYKIQRPFVVMTSTKVELQPLAKDFSDFLRSGNLQKICDDDGVIFLTDPAARANQGKTAIAVGTFAKQSALPSGEKIVIRGSTSMEKVIFAAAKAYADLYQVKADDVFDIQLEGSSKGVKAAQEGAKGNVVGLSSAKVEKDGIESFNLCLDAVAVIVNKNNDVTSDLTLKQLYEIYTGKVTKFSEVK